MKNTLFLVLLFLSVTVFSQKQNNTWIFGTSLGMKFADAGMTPLKDPVGPMRNLGRTSCFSDPMTGDLLFYTDGRTVWNKNHDVVNNGNLLSSKYVLEILIVPILDNKYLVFYSNDTDKLWYAEVTIWNNGAVEVTKQPKLLSGKTDQAFTAVKMLNSQGYWLITHKYHSSDFVVWPINSNGVIADSIVSSAGEVNYPGNAFYPNGLFSNNTGTRFTCIFGDSDINSYKPLIVQEFNFDKKCGLVSLNNTIIQNTGLAADMYAAGVYSPSGQFLYLTYQNHEGNSRLVQYDLSTNQPNENAIEIANGYRWKGPPQAAPDGKLYLPTSSQNNEVTSKISKVDYPDKKGMSCGYSEYAIELSTHPVEGTIRVEEFPNMILDISLKNNKSEPPVISVNQSCFGLPSILTINDSNSLVADSFQWDLGDGTFANTFQVVHQYRADSSYTVMFNWYLCGRRYTIADTIKLYSQPQVNLGMDTTLCNGNTILLSHPFIADEYRWSTGDSTATILVNKRGKYVLKVRSGNCWGEDEVEVKYYNPLWTTLGDEYFICDDDKELVKLDAGKDFIQYKWTPTGDTTQWIIVGDLGKYFVVVKDFRGCDGSDGTKVERRCPVSVFYPNAFTPNNDGTNDVYLPIGSDVVTFTLTIYNSWGQQIFKTQNISEGWDGKVNGIHSPSGTYFYKSTYSGYRNKKLVEFEAQGNITLLR